MTATGVPDVTTTSPSDWQYIAEGGASIVFAYDGRPNPVFDNTVLRLRKVPVNDTHEYTELEGEPDDKSIVFQERVISKLVPPEYLPMMVVAKVDTEWLEALSEKVKTDHSRPLERRETQVIDVHHRKAVLSNNLIGRDGLAVEIKVSYLSICSPFKWFNQQISPQPKWGFMPKQTHLSPETREAKSTRCRYCLHSHVRSKNGKVTSRGYCPLDLYSGDERRVTIALRRLWNAWIASDGTVNNIRLFVNGKLLDPNSVRLEVFVYGKRVRRV
jgi:inositol-pentakisphosphate 2-kinase